MAKIVVIDDDVALCKVLAQVLRKVGHEAVWASSLADGLLLSTEISTDIVLLDVCMPDGHGLNAISGIRHVPSHPEVIVMTGMADGEGAELAIRRGAWAYVAKGYSMAPLLEAVESAVQFRMEAGEVLPRAALQQAGIVGSSAQMRASLDLLSRAAVTDISVLIAGESGTGKELFARAVHENSHRRQHNFVVVDCAALPEGVVESILFGHEKGSFTGASGMHDGLVRQAHGGTLFLDEVGELPLAIQRVFLRVLQEHRFRPVGSPREMDSDFRLVAASNRDLDEMVAQGRFRADLLFRLRAFFVELPPLRERTVDIQEIAAYHLRRICSRYATREKRFSPQLLQSLLAYPWPGNVRELVQALEVAVVTAAGHETLYPRHLPETIRIQVARFAFDTPPSSLSSVSLGSGETSAVLGTLQQVRDAALAKVETNYLRALVREVGGNIDKACTISGLSRSRLYAVLQKHGIALK